MCRERVGRCWIRLNSTEGWSIAARVSQKLLQGGRPMPDYMLSFVEQQVGLHLPIGNNTLQMLQWKPTGDNRSEIRMDSTGFLNQPKPVIARAIEVKCGYQCVRSSLPLPQGLQCHFRFGKQPHLYRWPHFGGNREGQELGEFGSFNEPENALRTTTLPRLRFHMSIALRISTRPFLSPTWT